VGTPGASRQGARLARSDGYLWAGVRDTATAPRRGGGNRSPRADRAGEKLGIRFTHLDTHMGTLYARPDYFEVFAKLGQEYGVPILRIKPSENLRRDAPPQVIEYLLNNEERFRKRGLVPPGFPAPGSHPRNARPRPAQGPLPRGPAAT